MHPGWRGLKEQEFKAQARFPSGANAAGDRGRPWSGKKAGGREKLAVGYSVWLEQK
jgi:hypothetical protein